MFLLENPFYVLGASMRDTKQRILHLYEESILTDGNIEKFETAKNALINPRNRLYAELSWCPGLAPDRVRQIMQLIANNPDKLLSEICDIHPLARCNLLVFMLESRQTNDNDFIAKVVYEIAKSYSGINSSQLLTLINEDRTVAGIPLLKTIEQIDEKIPVLFDSYVQVCEKAVFYRRNDSCKILAKLLELSSDDYLYLDLELLELGLDIPSVAEIPEIVVSLVDRSKLIFATKFEDIQSGTKKYLASYMREYLTTEEKEQRQFDNHLSHIVNLIDEWQRFSDPIQKVAAYRGFEDDSTVEFAKMIRSFAIDIANNLQMYEESRDIVKILLEKFNTHTIFIEQLEEDFQAINKIISERLNQRVDELEITMLQLIKGNEQIQQRMMALKSLSSDFVDVQCDTCLGQGTVTITEQEGCFWYLKKVALFIFGVIMSCVALGLIVVSVKMGNIIIMLLVLVTGMYFGFLGIAGCYTTFCESPYYQTTLKCNNCSGHGFVSKEMPVD